MLLAWISIHPFRIPFWISPGVLGAPHQEVEFESEQGTVRGWWVPKEDSSRVAVIAHGYMMNRCELTPEAYCLWKEGVSCLLIDFRCHGKSRGSHCGLGFAERNDVVAAVRFARERVPNAKVMLIGSSMGSAAIGFAIGEDPSLADLVVFDSAYGKLSSAIQGWWRFTGGDWLATVLSPILLVAWPLIQINPFKIEVSSSIAKAGPIPMLFIHGGKDTLALPSEAQKNFDVAAGPKKLVWFEGCGHSEGRWLFPEKYREALFDFLMEHEFLEPRA